MGGNGAVSEHAGEYGGSQVFLVPGETQTAAELTKVLRLHRE